VPITYSLESVGSSKKSETNSANNDNLYDKVQWFNATEEEMIIKLVKTPEVSNDFILLNLDAMGYFRVNYESENWMKIVKQLDTKPEEIKDEMKAQLIHDSFALSQAGYVEADLPFRLTRFLARNSEYLPWNAFLKRFSFYENMLKTTRLWPPMEQKINNLVRSVYSFLGLKALDDKHSWVQNLMRSSVVDLACRHGLSECVNEAKTLFETWKNSPGRKIDYLK